MNLSTTISITAASIEVLLGLLVLRFSRAPGWRNLRVFVWIALSAAAFSINDVPSSLPHAPDWIVGFNRLNYLFGCVHVGAWFAYTRAEQHGEIRFRPRDRVALALLVVIGLLALWPGMLADGPPVQHVFSSWEVSYRMPRATRLGDAVGFVMMAMMGVPLLRFIRKMRAGEPGARAHVLGFSLFFLTCINEACVAAGVYEFPYVAGVGFLAMILVVLSELVRRVADDASLRAALSTRLEREVAERTSQLGEAREALIRAERLAALGQLAAGVGHEINNPLSFIHANLQVVEDYLARGLHPSDMREAVQDALEGSDRIRRVVADLRVYSRGEREEREETFSVREVVDMAVKLTSHQIKPRARVIIEEDEAFTVVGDRARLGQVFVNLLMNASQAIPDERAGRPESSIRVYIHAHDAAQVAIDVIDCGKGIAAEDQPHLFEPYYTTRAQSGGTGLGLFISHGIVTKLGGTIEPQTEPGVGTCMRVILPATPQVTRAREPAPDKSRTISVSPKARSLRILLVEDDEKVARSIVRALPMHELEHVSDVSTALRKLEDDRDYDAIVCDLMLSGGSGMDLYARLETHEPMLVGRVLFITGGAASDRARDFLARPELAWLPKPIDPIALQKALAALATQPSVSMPAAAAYGAA